MTTLAQISETQANKATTANENFEAVAPTGMYGRRPSATSGLTWGFYGGLYPGSFSAIADGTITLANNATNYVEANASGTVVVNSSGWTAGFTRLYLVTTVSSVVTAYTDYRTAMGVGYATLAGPNLFGAGAVGAPSVALREATTGLYSPAANQLAAAISGAQVGLFTATGFTAPGLINSDSTTDSTSPTTGSIQTDGGLGVVKALWVGGLANIAGVGSFGAAMSGTAGRLNLKCNGSGFTNGFVLQNSSTADSWSILATATNLYWGYSSDGTSFTTAFTMTTTSFGASIPILTIASTTGAAGLNIPHGAAPTSPTNGDIWTTTAGTFIRINGVTKSINLT